MRTELGHDEGRKWEETGGEDARPSGGRGEELGRTYSLQERKSSTGFGALFARSSLMFLLSPPPYS